MKKKVTKYGYVPALSFYFFPSDGQSWDFAWIIDFSFTS